LLAAVIAEAGLDARQVTEIVHGTTVASNTILQKTGARTGLLTTQGFRDVLEIGRIRTPGMFDMAWRKPEPLVPRRWRLEARERIAADGSIVTPLDEQSVRDAAAFFVAEGVEAVAICFICTICTMISTEWTTGSTMPHWPVIAASCRT
jgi:N-methylhydantoinase A